MAGAAGMKLSPTPDLRAPGPFVATVALTAITAIALLVFKIHVVTVTLGDTDDAMRLVLVRDLLHGRGWFDQRVLRLQPPEGVYLHWSRLLDGAIAAYQQLMDRLAPPGQAETWMRFSWPLLWIPAACACALASVRALGARSAVFVCALLLVADLVLYVQFRPGRIDHHNVQITLTLAAAACMFAARADGVALPALAGLSSALGLSVGVEALAFHALIGSGFALRFALDREAARAARAYGLALGAGLAALYLAETPPARILLPQCDAIGLNLGLGAAVAGFGLAGAATLARSAGTGVRVAALAGVGLAAALVYVGLDPLCLKGPFGSVDPRVRPFWFDHIEELESWPRILKENRSWGVHSVIVGGVDAACAAWLIARARTEPARGHLVLAVMVLLAVYAEAHASRMQDYAVWFGVEALAVAVGDLAAGPLGDRLIPVGCVAVLLSPGTLAGAADLAAARALGPSAASPADHCYDIAAYRPLAALAPGRVAAEPDLGPFVLAHTRDDVLSAPYHRMTRGILETHLALGAPPDAARARLESLGARYVLVCRAHAVYQPDTGLEMGLRRNEVPSWLVRRSDPRAPIQIFEVAAADPGR